MLELWIFYQHQSQKYYNIQVIEKERTSTHRMILDKILTPNQKRSPMSISTSILQSRAVMLKMPPFPTLKERPSSPASWSCTSSLVSSRRCQDFTELGNMPLLLQFI